MDPEPRVLTVGHSTHPIEEFLELLHAANVTCLVDVRTLPGSRHNPQFNQEALTPSLEASGIEYVREERLGGLRSKSHEVPPETNALWENQSFRRYADYAMSDKFEAGFDRLLELAHDPALPVIMCAEAVWWRCHRRIIADHLLARNVPVAHIMPDGRITEATLTKGARAQKNGRVTYPASPEQSD